MDLLGSILNSMDKPPSASEKEKEVLRKQKEHVEKVKLKEKQELNRFRKYAEERIGRFVKDDRKCIEFQPLESVYRAVIHDVAEIAGLVAMSFGQEGVDRYTIVYKKEHAPTEDEITARRNGEEWNQEKAKEYALKRELKKQVKCEKEEPIKEIVPATNYKDKYVHLIGQEAALDAARKTESNKTYGFGYNHSKKEVKLVNSLFKCLTVKGAPSTSHN